MQTSVSFERILEKLPLLCHNLLCSLYTSENKEANNRHTPFFAKNHWAVMTGEKKVKILETLLNFAQEGENSNFLVHLCQGLNLHIVFRWL